MDSARVRVLMIDDDEDEFVLTFDLLSQAEGKEYDLDWL